MKEKMMAEMMAEIVQASKDIVKYPGAALPLNNDQRRIVYLLSIDLHHMDTEEPISTRTYSLSKTILLNQKVSLETYLSDENHKMPWYSYVFKVTLSYQYSSTTVPEDDLVRNLSFLIKSTYKVDRTDGLILRLDSVTATGMLPDFSEFVQLSYTAEEEVSDE